LRNSYSKAYTRGGYHNCRVTGQPWRQNDFFIYAVVIQKFDSKSKGCYDVFSEDEISLSVEAQFNSRTVNCIIYRMDHYPKIHE
ncbi:unnamed protein product, partial [Dicrocoelium dendriticum]